MLRVAVLFGAIFVLVAADTKGVGITYLRNPDAPAGYPDGATGAQLNLPVWYPASLAANSVPFYFNNTLRNAKAVLNATPLKARARVIIFSPASLELPEFYYTIIENLVGRGYIVVGSKFYYELAQQNDWNADPQSSSYLIWARPKSVKDAISSLESSQSIENPQVALNYDSQPGHIIAMGHGDGAVSALAVTGGQLVGCKPTPLFFQSQSFTLWNSPDLCKKFLALASLSGSGPYSLADDRFGPTVLLDPGLTVLFPDSSAGTSFGSYFDLDKLASFQTPVMLGAFKGSQFFNTVYQAYKQFPSSDNEAFFGVDSGDFMAFYDLCINYPTNPLCPNGTQSTPSLTTIQTTMALAIGQFVDESDFCRTGANANWTVPYLSDAEVRRNQDLCRKLTIPQIAAIAFVGGALIVFIIGVLVCVRREKRRQESSYDFESSNPATTALLPE